MPCGGGEIAAGGSPPQSWNPALRDFMHTVQEIVSGLSDMSQYQTFHAVLIILLYIFGEYWKRRYSGNRQRRHIMKILVVEDEKDLNRIITRELESEGYLVDTCFDGESAYDYLQMEEYDGVILDVMLPRTDGFEVLKKARSKGVQTPVLFLTARSRVDDIVEGLDIGADDYMVKPFVFQELSARVLAMTRKKAGVRENIYRCGDLMVDCNEHIVKRKEQEIYLSPKEFSILLYLIRNQNIVVSREQIEANIWDLDHDSYSNVIDVYIRYLRKKIDDPFTFKMIQTIRGVGYVLRAEG